jgi:lycopene cyclase domain-containing protein
MDIYQGWLGDSAYYAFHLLAWILPIITLQWLAFRRILWPNRRVILLVPIIAALYFSATDVIAVSEGVWYFDNAAAPGWATGTQSRHLGLVLLGVPVEEIAFFYLTALLVTQSFVLFLPERLRWSARPRRA